MRKILDVIVSEIVERRSSQCGSYVQSSLPVAPGFPTKDYIEKHWEAYNNPNLTIWTGDRSTGGFGQQRWAREDKRLCCVLYADSTLLPLDRATLFVMNVENLALSDTDWGDQPSLPSYPSIFCILSTLLNIREIPNRRQYIFPTICCLDVHAGDTLSQVAPSLTSSKLQKVVDGCCWFGYFGLWLEGG
jgi:hypothetical protein